MNNRVFPKFKISDFNKNVDLVHGEKKLQQNHDRFSAKIKEPVDKLGKEINLIIAKTKHNSKQTKVMPYFGSTPDTAWNLPSHGGTLPNTPKKPTL